MKICAWVTIYIESARDELDINEKTIAFNKIDRVFFHYSLYCQGMSIKTGNKFNLLLQTLIAQ